jgi:hypothetical protein
MLDTSTVLAPYLFQTLSVERDRVAESRRWLRVARELKAHDRDRVEKRRTVIVNKPAHLAGSHKL